MTPSATPQAARGWWPRSLLGRNLLLMAVLIVLGQLVAAMLVRQLIFQPRVTQVADGVARNVGALRAGLQALPPAERAAFVEAFNQQAVRSLPPVAAESTVRRALLSPMERQFVQAVSRRLGRTMRQPTLRNPYGAATAPACWPCVWCTRGRRGRRPIG